MLLHCVTRSSKTLLFLAIVNNVDPHNMYSKLSEQFGIEILELLTYRNRQTWTENRTDVINANRDQKESMN